MIKIIGCFVVASILVCTQIVSQEARTSRGKEVKNVFATNECFPKEGLGIINTDLYIRLKSANNELLVGEAEKWTGQSAQVSEVVLFFNGKIWSTPVLPGEFDISKAIVISFESDKVRFFNFSKMTGGYYRRFKQN